MHKLDQRVALTGYKDQTYKNSHGVAGIQHDDRR